MTNKQYALFLIFFSLIFFVITYILTISYKSPESWIVLQLNSEGTPVKCFHIVNKGIDFTATGLSWENQLTEKIYISAPYRAVRVSYNRWESAYVEAGISSKACNYLETSLIDVSPKVNPNLKYRPLDSMGKHLDNIY